MLLLLLVGASALVSPITRVSGPGACASRHRAAASSARPRAVAVADGEAFDAAARAPSYLDLVKFAVPVSMIYTTNFLMGAIDTFSVGRYGGVVQLGALASACTAVEYVCYSFNFLQQATLAQLGRADGVDEKKSVLSVGLTLAVCAGLTQATLSAAFAPQMVKALGATPELAPLAATYVRIRGAGAWAYYLTLVGSASCFSVQDSTSPFVISIVAGLLNLGGNVLLCRGNPILGSAVAGAAAATLVSQLFAFVATFALLAKRGVLPDLRSESQKGRFHPFSFVSRFVNAPTLKRLTPSFFRAAGPISIVTLVRIFVYGFCGRMCCRLGTASDAAAHQIATNLWWGSSSLTAEPLDASILSFLPSRLALEDKQSGASDKPGRSRRLEGVVSRTTLRRHVVLSALIGGVVSLILAKYTTPANLEWIVGDAAVLAKVPVWPVLLCGLLVGPTLVLEGALVSLGKVKWLAGGIAAAAAVSCGGMLAVERGGILPFAPSHTTYWALVSVFVGLRGLFNTFGVRSCTGPPPPSQPPDKAD